MKTYKVFLTRSAKQDLYDIARYISTNLSAPYTSIEVIDILSEKIKGLKTSPTRHAFARDTRLVEKEIRAFPVKNYLVFYIVDENAQKVIVSRILYNRREWYNLL